MSASKKKGNTHSFSITRTDRIFNEEFKTEIPSKIIEFFDSLIGIYATLIHA